MSRDSIEKLGLILATAAAAAAVISVYGLSFPPDDLVNPLGIAALLSGAAWYYRRRGADTFVLCLTALYQVTLYTACFSVLMYSLAAIDRPFVDDALVTTDSWCRVSVPAIKAWTDAHPAVRSWLQWAYNSLLWQTPLLMVVLGFSGNRLRLEGFVRQFMLSTLACAAIFALWPAEGPFAAYGYEASATQARYLDHLHGLRDGSRLLVTWRGAEGLITFPSFHTCWAILIAWGLRGYRWISLPIALLNAAVILSTLTTGWHFFTDVVGGGITSAAAIAVSAMWINWRATAVCNANDADNESVWAAALPTLRSCA